MASRFTEDQKRAIQELVGLPPRLTPGTKPRKLSVPIEDLRRALGLAELPGGDLVAEDRWLVGGSIMRWLCGGLRKESDDPGGARRGSGPRSSGCNGLSAVPWPRSDPRSRRTPGWTER